MDGPGAWRTRRQPKPPPDPRRRRLTLIFGWLILLVVLAAGYFVLELLPFSGLILLFLGVIARRSASDPALRLLWTAYAVVGGLLLLAAFVLVLALNPAP